jgi:hypothetical protein
MAVAFYADTDEDEDEVIRLTEKHAIARYHVVGRDEDDRAITCYCGWHGHEGLFSKHRKANGLGDSAERKAYRERLADLG